MKFAKRNWWIFFLLAIAVGLLGGYLALTASSENIEVPESDQPIDFPEASNTTSSGLQENQNQEDGLPTSSDPAVGNQQEQIYLLADSGCVALEIADDNQERRQGLSGRANLAPDEGMIFLYEQSGNYSFWMRDMNFAIDMIWLDGSNRVVGLKENAQPSSYPESFSPAEPARKIIETVAGFATQANINIGDQLNLSDPSSNRPASCE